MERGLPHGPHEGHKRWWGRRTVGKCSDLGYILTVDLQVDWVWRMRDGEITDDPLGFVLSVRVGGGWGDRLGWRKVFEEKS